MARNRLEKGVNDLATCYPSIAAQWHPTLNAPLTPDNVAAGSSRTVWWCCPEGHEYTERVDRRAIDCVNCPYCENRIPASGKDIVKDHTK